VIGEELTVKFLGGASITWVLEALEQTEFVGQEWLRMSLACGERRRDALVTDEILGDQTLRRRVMLDIAAWEEDAYRLPWVTAYVWAREVKFMDGSSGADQLMVMTMDLEGTVQAIYPVEAS
jgi:hypothetical protein